MKIGDKLYKYQGFGKIAEYECLAVIERKDKKLFEVECKSCTHGDHCLVLVTKKDDETYKFCAMSNNDDQEAWHTSCSRPELYYLTAAAAKKAVYTDNINKCDLNIRQLSQQIQTEEKRKQELIDHLKNITEATK